MAKTTLQISIPQPCHEDWSKMTATQCGAFCNACQKEVVDFSQVSDAEIVDRLSKASGKVCGKIAADKLNRELVKYEPDHAWYSWKKWAVAAGVLLGVNSTKANTDNSPKPVETSVADTVQVKPTAAEYANQTDYAPTLAEQPKPILPVGQIITLTGMVTDDQNATLPFATINLPGTDIQTIADEHGVYTLHLPAENYYNKIQQVKAEVRMYTEVSSYILIDSLYKEVNLKVQPTLNIVTDEPLLMMAGGMGVEVIQVRGIKLFFMRIAYKIKQAKNKREERQLERYVEHYKSKK